MLDYLDYNKQTLTTKPVQLEGAIIFDDKIHSNSYIKPTIYIPTSICILSIIILIIFINTEL